MPEQSSPLDLAEGDPFGPHNLPYGVFSTPGRPEDRRVGVRVGKHVLDAGAAAHALGSPYARLLAQPSLMPLLAAGRTAWRDVRRALTAWVTVPSHRPDLEPLLYPLDSVTLHLPYEVADYVDFYASEHHATNVGRIFRPDGAALTPNWKHLPIGYHGRAARSSSPARTWSAPPGSARRRPTPSPSSAPR